ncbi:hypothetical protein D7X48_12655 [bacterium D16-50]|nr:hypothetical protein D7X48_12655 [bacterium D16-50]
MKSVNELSISKQYPATQYNLLGNTDVMVEVPDIKAPVVQVVRLDPDPRKKDVYIQQKGHKAYIDDEGRSHPETPDMYAIAKNGLKKLADGAGIKMVSSEHVIPTTCQKCVAANRYSGKVVQCGSCRNKDVAFRITISVPQLTGEVLMVEDTHEVIIDNVVIGMSTKQKAEFMKHLPQICEAKALNGAIRTALHIKNTYTLDEIRKPFVVAYLVPNLNHDDVKRAAIENMFRSSQKLFGSVAPSIQQVETRVPFGSAAEASYGEDLSDYIDGTYTEASGGSGVVGQSQEQEDRVSDFRCDKCNEVIPRNVWDYSVDHYDRPLCYKCQKIVRNGQRGGMRK